MSDPISAGSVTITGVKELLAKLKSVTDRERVVKKGLNRSGIYFANRVKNDYLSGRKGRYGLNVVNNRLRPSFTSKSAVVDDNGGYVEVGTDVEYAPYHEFGFTGTVNVPAFKRKVSSIVKVMSSSLKTKKTTSRNKRMQTGTAEVKAHTRNVNYAGRPFIAPVRDDPRTLERIVGIFKEVIQEQLEKKQ